MMLNKMSHSAIARYVTLFGVLMVNLGYVSITSADEIEALNTLKTVYLVRHAEKEKGNNRNPNLTDKGKFRAINLARMLKNKNIEIIYSTQYARTMQTASPMAKELGLKIQGYDPRNLKQFADSILSKQVNMLIVGHSNTTPSLVQLLGGSAEDKINESEYNRVYKLQFNKHKVVTELLYSSAVQPK